MEQLRKRFESGGWTFNYDMVVKSGLVLGDVMHDGYHLARDMRVVRIWINASDTDESNSKSFCLGSDELQEVTTNHSTYLRYNNFNAPPPFDIYTQPGLKSAAGVQAIYKTKSKVFGDDGDDDDDYLIIEQSFIFTKYGKDPAHEPGGVLEAARVFPLIKFSYGGKKIKSIRIDYRFEISLDLFLYGDSNELDSLLDTGLLKKLLENLSSGELRNKLISYLKNKRPMLAGIFRDAEEFPSLPTTSENFDAFEKPVLWEVIGYGLKRGIPGEKITAEENVNRVHEGPASTTTNRIAENDKSTWDNIHMWANCRIGPGYLKRNPTAPGAFHAFHCHWRWPDYFAHVVDRLKAIVGGQLVSPFSNPFSNAFGEQQFKGLPLKGHIGGPLLDPKIPTQTIQFAITKSKAPGKTSPKRWEANQCPSERKFEDLFILTSPQPGDISAGENIVTWLSITVENAGTLENKRFEGTVMQHGMFFAHNDERTLFRVPSALTSGVEPMQKPEKPKGYKPKWIRSPNDKQG